MSNTKISSLTSAATPLAGTEVLPVNQSGVTTQVSVANLTSGRAVGVSSLTVTNANPRLTLSNTGTGYTIIDVSSGGGSFYVGADDSAGSTFGTSAYARILYGYGNYPMIFAINGLEKFRIDTSSNFVPKVAGAGINYTANTPQSGMTSQLLNWYEEGTWTPNQGGGLTVIGAFSSTGKYTRIGRNVTISGTVTGATSVAVIAAGVITTNLPFTVGTAGHGNATNAAVNAFSAVICSSTNVTSAGAIASTGTITFSATYFV